MNKILLLTAAALVTVSSFSQEQKVYEHNYLVKVGDTAP